MIKKVIKIFSILTVIAVLFSCVAATHSVVTAEGSGDFSMDEFDKAYITFVFDDGLMPFSKECFELFNSFKMPMSCAIIAQNVKGDNAAIDIFKKIEKAGGEILSHTYSHNALQKDNCTVDNIEKQLGDSFRVLTGLGFDINGVIEAGNGGDEATADYELIETISRKYYKYSNAYGVSPQYKKKRLWLRYNTLSSMKAYMDDAIKNKQWLVVSAHSFDEFSKENLTQLLTYINDKGKSKIEVATWKYVYEKFGNYTGPKIPTVEAIESVCKMCGHDLKDPVVYKAATCEKGPVLKGVCKRCGKTGTYQSKTGALGHKFGKFVSDNNATCTDYSTMTAKCTVKGCDATRTEIDYGSTFKHKLKTVVVKEATATTEGLAERRCELCGYVETVVIPKGKKAEDVISSETDTKKEATQSKDNSTKDDTVIIDATDTIEQNENVIDAASAPGMFNKKVITQIIVTGAIVLVLLAAGIFGLVYVIKKRGL